MVVKEIFFEDEMGKILTSDEVNELYPWEIEDRKLHVYDDDN